MDGGARFQTDHYELLRVGYRRDLAEAEKYREKARNARCDEDRAWFERWEGIYRRGAEQYLGYLKEKGLHV